MKIQRSPKQQNPEAPSVAVSSEGDVRSEVPPESVEEIVDCSCNIWTVIKQPMLILVGDLKKTS